jgi:hypothetical protein
MRIIDCIHQLLAQDEGCFHLEGEGLEQPIMAPKSEVIARELARLRSAGPSFLALVAPNGNYLQAAGNAKRMTVEAHVITPKRTTQVVLGRRGSPGTATTIDSTVGGVVISASEVWSAFEATDLFSAFVATGSIPATLTQRDITAEIALS